MEPLGSVTKNTQNYVFIVDIQHVFNEEIRSVGKALHFPTLLIIIKTLRSYSHYCTIYGTQLQVLPQKFLDRVKEDRDQFSS